jgi:hypothetical protein
MLSGASFSRALCNGACFKGMAIRRSPVATPVPRSSIPLNEIPSYAPSMNRMHKPYENYAVDKNKHMPYATIQLTKTNIL